MMEERLGRVVLRLAYGMGHHRFTMDIEYDRPVTVPLLEGDSIVLFFITRPTSKHRFIAPS